MSKLTRWVRGLAITLIVSVGLTVSAMPAMSADAASQSATRGLIGMYVQGAERFLVRERAGQLEMLYDTGDRVETMFAAYSGYSLQPVAADTFQLLSYSPLRKEAVPVRFERDRGGHGIAAIIGTKTYKRQFFDVEEGKTFQIKALLPTDKLRQGALAGSPPIEKGTFLSPDLVEVASLDATIRLDIRYATTNNFMGIQLYDEARAFLQRPAAEAVVRVQTALKKYKVGLIVYDAYRPWYVTKMFWDATPDSQKVFVADPSKGSRHNRGGAVDVGLYSLQTGEVLDMGSDYDEFSIRAYPTYPGGTAEQRERREMLRILMEGEGFTIYPEEWWHFDYSDWRKYPILNVRFSEL
ncbi:MAG TPA: M15 family metallopeptidase [Negativicutes bacterium]|nr:M15 family metallopeptidase [Negativicutes bacterium]